MVAFAYAAKHRVAENKTTRAEEAKIHDSLELQKDLPDVSVLHPILTVEDFKERAAAHETREKILGIRKQKLAQLTRTHGIGPINVTVVGYSLEAALTVTFYPQRDPDPNWRLAECLILGRCMWSTK